MDKILKQIKQFIQFGLVGVSNTLISLGVYYGLLFLNCNYLLATATGYILSSISGYFLNKLWVFRAQKQAKGKSVYRYYIVYLSSLILNILLMKLWVDVLFIPAIIAPLLTLCFTIPYNFLFSKFWVFSNKTKDIEE